MVKSELIEKGLNHIYEVLEKDIEKIEKKLAKLRKFKSKRKLSGMAKKAHNVSL